MKLHLKNKIINVFKYLMCDILRELGLNEDLIAKGFFNYLYI